MAIGLTVFVLLLLLDVVAGEFRKPRALSMNELGVNVLSIAIAFSIRGVPLAAIGMLLPVLWPQGRDILAHAPVWLVFIAVLVLDDYGNYWLHRMAHQRAWLWQLHKPHHIPTRMNVLMGVRENTLYYLLLPVNIMAPLLAYVGAAPAGAIMVGVKLVVVYLQHVSFRWDLWLRRFAVGRLLLNGAERFIALQDFHHAHHGIGRYGNAASNYGNVLNLWDQLHGTSNGHPHRPQDAYGLPAGVAVEPWAVQLFWPLVRVAAAPRAPEPALTPSSEQELREARAVIVTADGTAIAVQ